MSNNVITTKETVATSTTNIIDGEGLPLVAHSTNTNAASLQVFDATLHNRSLMGVSMHSLTAIVDANYTTSNSLSAQLRTSSGSVITSVSTTVVVGNYSTTQIIPELGVNKSYTFTGTYPNAYSLAYVGVYTNGSTYTLEPSLTFQLSGSQITAT